MLRPSHQVLVSAHHLKNPETTITDGQQIAAAVTQRLKVADLGGCSNIMRFRQRPQRFLTFGDQHDAEGHLIIETALDQAFVAVFEYMQPQWHAGE